MSAVPLIWTQVFEDVTCVWGPFVIERADGTRIPVTADKDPVLGQGDSLTTVTLEEWHAEHDEVPR